MPGDLQELTISLGPGPAGSFRLDCGVGELRASRRKCVGEASCHRTCRGGLLVLKCQMQVYSPLNEHIVAFRSNGAVPYVRTPSVCII